MSIVHFIGAGPGDPDLITVKGKRLIESAPVVLYAGSLVPPALVAIARPGATVIDTAALTLDEIIDHMAKRDRRPARMWRACIPATRRSMAPSASRCGAWTSSASPMT